MAAESVEIAFSDQFNIVLEKIEFDEDQYIKEDDEGGEEAFDRVVFQYRLYFGEGYTTLPVTMTSKYKDLADLKRNAEIELYSILSHFAESARRMAGVPLMTFKFSE